MINTIHSQTINQKKTQSCKRKRAKSGFVRDLKNKQAGRRGGSAVSFHDHSLAVSGALADLLEDSLVRNLAEVGSLDLGVDAGKGTAQGVLGGRVDHLGLSRKWVSKSLGGQTEVVVFLPSRERCRVTRR